MSSLQAVKGFRLKLDLVYQIIKEYSHLTEGGKRIVICWIPSHLNIPGNEKADSAAKSALINKMKILATEYIPGVSQFCLKEWQDIWKFVRVTSFMLFTQTLVEFHTEKPVPARCSGH